MKSFGLTDAAVVTEIFSTFAGSEITIPGTGVCWPFSIAHSPIGIVLAAVGKDELLVFQI